MVVFFHAVMYLYQGKGKKKHPNVMLQYVLSCMREATHICLNRI